MRSRSSVLWALTWVVACGAGDGGPVVRVDAGEGSPAARGTAPEVQETGGPRGRVVFLGTSLTAGYGLEDPALAFPGLLANRIDSAGLPFEVVNAGVSGDTSAGGLGRLSWLLDGGVDVLVVELGANDGLRGLSPDALEANLDSIVVRTLRSNPDARIVLAGMEAPPNLGRPYVERFRAVFPRVADRHDVSRVAFLLEDVAGQRELNQADGIHPTVLGHARIADTVWPVLRDVLEDAGRGAP